MRRASLPLAISLISFAIFSLGMSFPWQMALLTALAIGALTYSTQRTLENLRYLSDRGGPESASASRPWFLPGKEDKGSDEQRMGEHGWPNAPEEQSQPATEEAAGKNESS